MNYYESGSYRPYSHGQIQPYMIPAAEPVSYQQTMDADIYTYPQNLQDALDLIREAVTGESEDRMFYTWLISQAPSDEDIEIISGIRDNEIRHYALFRQIYYDLTGVILPQSGEEEFNQPVSYFEGLAQALMGEQNAVQKYRKIFYAMQSRIHMNMMIEIITDEIRHGILYNYLYSKNGIGSLMQPYNY
ncbi:ferritin-like domain-containing protein [Clostridium sp. Marseille-P2415]|uniref:ferritin-like domain-containing protein n=1 Tax=Clostridium sp. Marseille-P2415 TaxID=1805471 RepID=UPI0009888AEE|nr:ferritin-like domain-containing protein [Clostridium sp. Marseille-P2415]